MVELVLAIGPRGNAVEGEDGREDEEGLASGALQELEGAGVEEALEGLELEGGDAVLVEADLFLEMAPSLFSNVVSLVEVCGRIFVI